ncbi:hypothetical protein V9T40_006226 [Parthenolecanium corni]|uniref:Uncharacterized protein n=1 Tax=Parthenolecanium corni TaxID=536013 RepID=A0AAN9TTY5_9HEMI
MDLEPEQFYSGLFSEIICFFDLTPVELVFNNGILNYDIPNEGPAMDPILQNEWNQFVIDSEEMTAASNKLTVPGGGSSFRGKQRNYYY